MKYPIKITQVATILLVLFACGGFINQNSNNIVGSWISEDDSNSKWVFTNNAELKVYYKDDHLLTYTYSVHSTLPQCATEWENPNPNLKYLVLEEQNTVNKTCYVIYNLDEQHLSISEFGKGGVQVFNKQ
ncbi:MAG: hypothetical protein JXR26_10235 [Balneolaceae bacterium]|nr:hypothetical protein [Balneolaceae bacterium]